jgi:hypothetical protein
MKHPSVSEVKPRKQATPLSNSDIQPEKLELRQNHLNYYGTTTSGGPGLSVSRPHRNCAHQENPRSVLEPHQRKGQEWS